MTDLWLSFPALAQDLFVLVSLLSPIAAMTLILNRQFAVRSLVTAMLWRFRWANFTFIALIASAIGIGTGLIAQEQGIRKGTASAADKFELIISAPGSEMTMMLASVYLQPSDVALLDGQVYNAVANHKEVEVAAPLAFGDSYEGAPIIGTTAAFGEYLSDGKIQGRSWQSPFEAIAGAAAGIVIGDRFQPSHGRGDAVEEMSHEQEFTVVGTMPRTGTPWDRAILVPVEAVWLVHGLATGHAPERAGQIGPPFDADYFPGTPAIIVKATELWANYALHSEFNRQNETMAFFPATVLSELYRVMGDIRQAMSVMSVITQILVAISVLLALFILTRLFARQMALLRAVGAPGRFLVATVWSYCATLIVSGTGLGLALGQAAASMLSRIITQRTDILVQATLGWTELHLAAGFASGVLLLALLPAIAVLRQPLLENLRT
jgi:putative ABC transport system permease protein